MSAAELVTVVLVLVIVQALVVGVLRTIAHRIGSQVRRHDMIVEARRRRAEYLRSVTDRQQAHAGHGGVEIEG